MMAEPFPPRGTCDCHVHVIGPKAAFPLTANRSYTPVDAPVGQLAAKLDELGIDRVVIVQPSIYGTDNACLVDALGVLGDRARGIAVVEPNTPAAELDRLHSAGTRGLRLNLVSSGHAQLDDARALLSDGARLCARHGWHLQIFSTAPLIEELRRDFLDCPVDIVFDHFGMISPGSAGSAYIQTLASLLESGRAWLKLSAPYRIAEDFADPAVAELARTFAAINPERLVWGTDWPHTPAHSGKPGGATTETPYRDIASVELLNAVSGWFPDTRTQSSVLVKNPARLYGWPV